MTPAYLSDRALAAHLGLSLTTLRKKRPDLEREGFPKKDGLVGMTLTADVDAWLARRRVVPDRSGVHISVGHQPSENVDAL
jgi:DNA-binding transcriptional regulator YhcF (GntR family)